MPSRIATSRPVILRRVLLTSLFIIFLLGLWLVSLPSRYKASARLMVHVPQEVPAETYDPDRILKAFQNVKSNPILDPVIEQFALPQKWHLSPEACLKRLAANLHVRQFRDASVIQIEFTDPNPDLSVAITSAISQKCIESTNRQVGGFAGLRRLEPLEPPTPNPKRLPWYSLD